MIDTEKEQEIWKVYPKYHWVEVSNLGNVRTKDHWVTYKNGTRRLYKGHISKKWFDKDGYLCVSIHINGKQVNLRVHRLVSVCFIPNPSNYPEVNHKDNDRTNNVVSNLEWCTRKYNDAYKKNFGTSQAELQGRPVYAVDLKTGKVLWFKSQHEAARKLNINRECICLVINGKLNTAGDYWFTEDKSKITEEKIQEIKAKMHFYGGAIAVDLETSEVLWFKSQSEAARQLGANLGCINMVIKGKRNKTGGYWFTYADENALEKTREKFGDDIANKVEKLIR